MRGSSIAHRNNISVSCIETGNYNEAISGLSNCLRTYLPKDGVLISGNQCNARLPTADYCILQGREIEGLGNFENNMPYMYRHAIRIPSSLELTMKTKDAIASILVFNLALAHHLLFLSCCQIQGENSRQKAIMLYDIALDLQSSRFLESGFVFVLATLNNLALLHMEQNDLDRATQFFRKMLSILVLIVEMDSDVPPGCLLLNGFYHNVLTYGGSYLAAPAA
eukprot:scaffold26259_cov108-Cylindrotheca_fusiformis.AAC.2